MTDMVSHDVNLPGCTPEPLMAYLKALGILRLVGEQKDGNARGWWKNDTFSLRSTLNKDDLAKFFLEEYKPTPIVVPWSGGDFFSVNWEGQPVTFLKTPTSSKAIEAILTTQTPRFDSYRSTLRACKAALNQCGIDSKEKMGDNKWTFIQTLRSICDDAGLIEWIDAAAVSTVEKFAALLGSGGGSDGNTHFSDNFMQNLWDALPEFDTQRKPQKGPSCHPVADGSRAQLDDALFKLGTSLLIYKPHVVALRFRCCRGPERDARNRARLPIESMEHYTRPRRHGVLRWGCGQASCDERIERRSVSISSIHFRHSKRSSC